MTPIRPNAYPPQTAPTTVAGQAADAARAAAQKAFFDAAMGRAAAPTAPQAPQAPQATAFNPVARPQVQPAATGGEPPAKILRPGSLLDIRV